MREVFDKELYGAVNAGSWLVKQDRDPEEAAREMAEAELAMAGGIRGVFAGIYEYYNNDARLTGDVSADGRISQGIAETVFIKVESLDEAAAAIKTAIEPLRAALADSGERQEPPWLAELAESSFNAMVDEMARFQKEDRRALSAVKKYMNFRPDSEVYAEYASRLTRPAAKTLEQIEMKLLKFKKEQTLYEISTFEEIQLYSVSRLRESKEPHIVDFVSYLDSAGLRIIQTLAEYGITPVRPVPRDIFNGREHEVLMAEQSEEYKKGEIIKLLNSGYKQGDVVLLRANVIAAR
jgi:hypothetical protein